MKKAYPNSFSFNNIGLDDLDIYPQDKAIALSLLSSNSSDKQKTINTNSLSPLGSKTPVTVPIALKTPRSSFIEPAWVIASKSLPPQIKQWVNGIYSFNKNYTKNLPQADTVVYKIIRSFFTLNLIANNPAGKKTKLSERRFKRLSLNKIFISKPEIKHSNNKVFVTVYLFNKKKISLLYKLKQLYNKLTYNNNTSKKEKDSFSKNQKFLSYLLKLRNTLALKKGNFLHLLKTMNKKNGTRSLSKRRIIIDKKKRSKSINTRLKNLLKGKRTMYLSKRKENSSKSLWYLISNHYTKNNKSLTRFFNKYNKKTGNSNTLYRLKKTKISTKKVHLITSHRYINRTPSFHINNFYYRYRHNDNKLSSLVNKKVLNYKNSRYLTKYKLLKSRALLYNQRNLDMNKVFIHNKGSTSNLINTPVHLVNTEQFTTNITSSIVNKPVFSRYSATLRKYNNVLGKYNLYVSNVKDKSLSTSVNLSLLSSNYYSNESLQKVNALYKLFTLYNKLYTVSSEYSLARHSAFAQKYSKNLILPTLSIHPENKDNKITTLSHYSQMLTWHTYKLLKNSFAYIISYDQSIRCLLTSYKANKNEVSRMHLVSDDSKNSLAFALKQANIKTLTFRKIVNNIMLEIKSNKIANNKKLILNKVISKPELSIIKLNNIPKKDGLLIKASNYKLSPSYSTKHNKSNILVNNGTSLLKNIFKLKNISNLTKRSFSSLTNAKDINKKYSSITNNAVSNKIINNGKPNKTQMNKRSKQVLFNKPLPQFLPYYNQLLRNKNSIIFSLEKENKISKNQARHLWKKEIRKTRISLLNKMNGNNSSERYVKNTLVNLIILRRLNKVNKFFRLYSNIITNNNNENYNNSEIISSTKDNIVSKYKLNYIKQVIAKEYLYVYYIKLLKANSYLFKNWFLNSLKTILSKIYNKKVILNLVNLKYIHLNSDIFTEAIAIRLKNYKKNRVNKVLRKALKLVAISKSKPEINDINNPINKYMANYYDKFLSLPFDIFNDNSIVKDYNNLAFSRQSAKYENQKHFVLPSLYGFKLIKGLNSVKSTLLNFIRHKSVFGVRLEAAGRLTKRSTASRAIFKLRYKGSLRNIPVINRGNASTIIKNQRISNLQFTKISSKTRNGAFGLKGWLNNA